MERGRIYYDNPAGFTSTLADHYHEPPMRLRSRSFGSESDWNYRDTFHEGSLHRSYSTEFQSDNSLQGDMRTPKYISSVYVQDDSFAINHMQVPGAPRGISRFYSQPAPARYDVQHQNPAYASDSDSDIGRPRTSRQLRQLYLPDRVPMQLTGSPKRTYLDDEYSSRTEPSDVDQEKLGHINPIFLDDQTSVSDGGSAVHRRRHKNDKNRVSPVSPEAVEMTTVSYVGSIDTDEVDDSKRLSDFSLQSSRTESVVREPRLDTSVSTNTTYLVDDPRYILGPRAAIGKQKETVPNAEIDNVQKSPTDSLGSRLRKGLKCHRPHPRQWGRRKRVCISIIGSIILVGLILFIALFPASFIYVEYDKIALRRTKSTWKVQDETYYPGCYLHGPDMEFYTYNATAHKEFFDEIDVFTADKNTIEFSATVWWFIRSEELPVLYNKFGRNFSSVFPDMFLSTMRNTAPQFTSRDYLSKRAQIEATMHQALYDKVSGTCCPLCCTRNSRCSTNFLTTQCSRCSREPSCDKGHHIEIRYFYIGEIEIPEEIESRYLKSLIVEIENEKAQFEQEVSVTQINNDLLVKNILNQAEEIKATSEAEAKKIKEISEVEGDAIEQKATVSGLNGMCSKFDITEEDHKLSLFFFNSIKSMKNLYGFIYDK